MKGEIGSGKKELVNIASEGTKFGDILKGQGSRYRLKSINKLKKDSIDYISAVKAH